ncbi:hypothetical protein [Halobacteriovorax sp.]|uniref:hypothetical protein n=1 Tax=Halobacteriovorax sp. TaxID=2020862 RepID=UPI00356461E7
MKVFTTFKETLPAANENSKRRGPKKNGPSKVKKSYRPPREKLSAEDIKARVAQKTAKPDKKVEVTAGKQVSTFMSEEAAAAKPAIRTKPSTATAVKGLGNPEEIEKSSGGEEAKKVLLHSDVQKNDPKDTNVQEKLKGLLNSNGFGWNEKERAALSEILGKN